jgi:hypothetical protein
MASTSGTIYSAYGNGSRFYMTWQRSQADTANNRSLISWQVGLEISSGGWWWGSNSIKIYSIHVDGGASLGSGTWSNISGTGRHQLRSGSKWVTHNSDGTKSFGANMSGWLTGEGNRSASGSWTLPTIPRNSQVTTGSSSYTLGSAIGINTNRKSTSFTHTITLRQNNNSGTLIRQFNSVGASVTWTPTAGEITTMQNLIPTSNRFTLYIRSYNNQVGEASAMTVPLNLADANPTFSDFTFADTDATTTGITGNNQVLVKGKSVLQVDVSSANKMAAIKGASEDRYSFSFGGTSEQASYHATNTVSGTFNDIQTTGNRTIQVTAFDSRNNATSVSKSVTVYDYKEPVINTKLLRENNFGSDTTIQINGTYTPLTIGTPKNTLTVGSLEYRYKEEYGSFGSWVTRTFTANSTTGTFTSTDTIVSLDNTKKYLFEFRITDSFGTVTTTNSVDVGTPIMFIGKNSGTAAIGINKMPEDGALDVDGDIYSNGSKVSTSDTQYKIGVIPSSTFSTTGNKSITGIGFTPKLVRFTVLPSSSTTIMNTGFGAMDDSGNQYAVGISTTSTGRSRNSLTIRCIYIVDSGATSPATAASYVSMDADGFTINVNNAGNIFDIAYEAIG